MKIKVALYLLLLLFNSCGIQDGRPDGVFIRVQNNSDVNFTDLNVQSGNIEKSFGSISARSYSDYKEFEYAFKYAAVWLKVDRHELSLIPVDYVGELPLKNGFYTYRIGLTAANIQDASLILELVKD